ncbi:hypothetical protein EA187_13565 [Lujinxingia sediminis]|uniref:Lipoprotein n=1 Tax=Lujinxingia sediminis TaxID=2480984 RepID=A0ABY0CSS4_9DELT|nr:hypothetical protein [Lujinxingia sediminis]RVU43232.1 hypothetical protein EA187_13565 [Lujinxingia sediminis]
MLLPSPLHALRLSLCLAMALSATACSPEHSRACEVDANCFVDEQCIAGFCQFDPTPEGDTNADAEAPDAEEDTDAREPDAEDDANTDAEEDTDVEAPDTEEDTDVEASDAEDATIDPSPICLDHQSICDNRCVDLHYDSSACGNCAITCNSDQECIEGSCAQRLDTAPQTGTIGTDTSGGFGIDMTLDDASRPHITHISNATDTTLHYLRWDGQQWRGEFSHPVEGLRPTRIALDVNNRPHILFGDPTSTTSETLRYAAPSDGVWHVETVATPRFARDFDLALAPDGSPRVVFVNANDEVTLATRTSPDLWEHTLVDHQNTAGSSVAIAVDQQGLTHIAYQRFTNGGELIYATSTSTGWDKTSLASTHNGGLGISMTLDPQDRARIAARANTPANPAILYLHNTSEADPRVWSELVFPLESNATTASTSIALFLGTLPLIGFQQDTSARIILYDGSFSALDAIDASNTGRTALSAGANQLIQAALQAPGGGLYYFINR